MTTGGLPLTGIVFDKAKTGFFFCGRGTYLFIPCLRAHVRWRSSAVYLNPPVWSIILIAIDHIDYCKTKIKESNLFLIISLQNKELKMKYLFSEDQLSSLVMSNNLVSFIYSTKPLGLPCYSNEVFNEDFFFIPFRHRRVSFFFSCHPYYWQFILKSIFIICLRSDNY